MGKSEKGSGVVAYTINFTRRSRRQFLKLPTQIQRNQKFYTFLKNMLIFA